jgi:hypothetical protein
LGRVLILAGALDDEHEAVVGDVGLKLGAGGPDIAAIVLDRLSDGSDGLDVGAGAPEEDQRDGAFRGGGPLNGIRLADRDDLVKPGLEDGIALGRLGVVRRSMSRDQGRED